MNERRRANERAREGGRGGERARERFIIIINSSFILGVKRNSSAIIN